MDLGTAVGILSFLWQLRGDYKRKNPEKKNSEEGDNPLLEDDDRILRMSETFVGPDFIVSDPVTRDELDNIAWVAWKIDTTNMEYPDLVTIWTSQAIQFDEEHGESENDSY
jgi:hypothetical protein